MKHFLDKALVAFNVERSLFNLVRVNQQGFLFEAFKEVNEVVYLLLTFQLLERVQFVKDLRSKPCFIQHDFSTAIVHVSSVKFLPFSQVDEAEERSDRMLQADLLNRGFVLLVDLGILFILPRFRGNFEPIVDHSGLIDALLKLFYLLKDEGSIVFELVEGPVVPLILNQSLIESDIHVWMLDINVAPTLIHDCRIN